MANLMVRELEWNEELDRKALRHIFGAAGEPPVSNYGNPIVVSTTQGAIDVIGNYTGAVVFTGTVLQNGRLYQEWQRITHKISHQEIKEVLLSNFTGAGMP